MNKKLLFASTALTLYLATGVQASDIEMNTARMQAMDKITGRVSEIDVPVNGLTNFGTFSILVRKCVTKSPEETPENTAFVDVVDNYQSDNPTNIFKGWMFSSTPALNAVEHPIYDVWLLKCYNSQAKAKLLTADQLALRDSIPMIRKEAKKPMSGFTLAEPDSKEAPQTGPANETITVAAAPVEPEVIRLDVNDQSLEKDAKENESSTETDEENFVSEGEENLEFETNTDSASEFSTAVTDETAPNTTETADSTEEVKPLL
jgi:hypothetical protein